MARAVRVDLDDALAHNWIEFWYQPKIALRKKQLASAEASCLSPLARVIVADCVSDKVNAPLCKTAIDLAHNFGRTAVAVGIEKTANAETLLGIGCDFGRGLLLGQPMPQERLLSPLRQRAATTGRGSSQR